MSTQLTTNLSALTRDDLLERVGALEAQARFDARDIAQYRAENERLARELTEARLDASLARGAGVASDKTATALMMKGMTL